MKHNVSNLIYLFATALITIIGAFYFAIKFNPEFKIFVRNQLAIVKITPTTPIKAYIPLGIFLIFLIYTIIQTIWDRLPEKRIVVATIIITYIWALANLSKLYIFFSPPQIDPITKIVGYSHYYIKPYQITTVINTITILIPLILLIIPPKIYFRKNYRLKIFSLSSIASKVILLCLLITTIIIYI